MSAHDKKGPTVFLHERPVQHTHRIQAQGDQLEQLRPAPESYFAMANVSHNYLGGISLVTNSLKRSPNAGNVPSPPPSGVKVGNAKS